MKNLGFEAWNPNLPSLVTVGLIVLLKEKEPSLRVES